MGCKTHTPSLLFLLSGEEGERYTTQNTHGVFQHPQYLLKYNDGSYFIIIVIEAYLVLMASSMSSADLSAALMMNICSNLA